MEKHGCLCSRVEDNTIGIIPKSEVCMMDPVINVENLTKHYKRGVKGRVIALEDLDLQVEEGEIFGFVGPNGAGKSTTIKMMVNLLFPTRGRVRIMGWDAAHPSARRELGYLPENPSFYDHLTGGEFLSFTGSLVGLKGKILKSRAEELLKLVGLPHRGNLQIRKYSKGMLQRLGIAQALMGDPKVVIMDEPMSGLDPLGRAEVARLILSLKHEGKTIFFSSHILHDVETVCDRVGILVKGKLAYLGHLSDLADREPGWVVRLEGDRTSVLAEEERCDKVFLEGRLTKVELSKDRLWAFLNIVQDLDLPIHSIEKKRLGLEELFIRQVQSETWQ